MFININYHISDDSDVLEARCHRLIYSFLGGRSRSCFVNVGTKLLQIAILD